MRRMMKTARMVAPMTLLEVLLQLRVTQNYLSLNTHFNCCVVVYKTLKFVLLLMFVPLEGLCYLLSMLSFLLYAFWTHLFAL